MDVPGVDVPGVDVPGSVDGWVPGRGGAGVRRAGAGARARAGAGVSLTSSGAAYVRPTGVPSMQQLGGEHVPAAASVVLGRDHLAGERGQLPEVERRRAVVPGGDGLAADRDRLVGVRA